jgi:hypothetical protein
MAVEASKVQGAGGRASLKEAGSGCRCRGDESPCCRGEPRQARTTERFLIRRADQVAKSTFSRSTRDWLYRLDCLERLDRFTNPVEQGGQLQPPVLAAMLSTN